MRLTIPWYSFDRQTTDADYLTKATSKPAKTDGSGKIRCRSCHQVITDGEQGIHQNGSHIHTCTNPHDHCFRFACYQEAPGCTQVGSVSYEHSWFTGHSWQIALCGACGEHLGWLFTGEDRFYGLIVNRLVDENQPSV